MENYFILLELSFDPIETDENIINEALNKKIQQWQNESKNPRKAIIAKEKLAQVPDIKKIMFDESLRKKEAEKALEEKKKIIKDIYYDVLIKSTKGTITTEEIDEVYNKYKNFNISKNDVLKQVSVPIDSEIEEENTKEFEIIDSNIKTQLETYFENLSIDDMSLYEFIKTNPDDDIEYLLKAAESKLQFILQKGEKTSQDEMEQKIAGIAKTLFSSKELKQQYDNYLSGCRYRKLNRLIQDGIKSNNNMLNANLYNIILSIMINDYKMFKSDAIDYINNYCKINNINLDQNIISKIILEQIKTPEDEEYDYEPVEKKDKKTILEEIDEDKEDYDYDTNETIDEEEIEIEVVEEIYKPSNNKNNLELEFLKIVKPIEKKINENRGKMNEYYKEICYYEQEYIMAGRLPNLIVLVIYLIVLALAFLMNFLMLLTFYNSMHNLIKIFILIMLGFIIFDGIYFIIKFIHTKDFYKYKRMVLSEIDKYDLTTNNKYVNHDITEDDIATNKARVIKYFDNVYYELNNICIMAYNFKVKTLNTISKFNKAPIKGYVLGTRIITVLFFTIIFYFIVLKFFPLYL